MESKLIYQTINGRNGRPPHEEIAWYSDESGKEIEEVTYPDSLPCKNLSEESIMDNRSLLTQMLQDSLSPAEKRWSKVIIHPVETLHVLL